ncbi:MAG: Ni/Fe hydrogenase subunit alpha [Candidatus Berkelbacteria bacterium]|nr:Ni/Fe hydrogenase subunit alpha [Candidatus Berkelbacteria bacterium]
METAVPKIEGHAAFYTHLKSGHVDKARIIGLENDRFVERILVGRKYWEAPIITSRICGICPVIHNITSTRAIENACNIEVSNQTILLRKLMLAGQMVQSHSLHLYLLVLPDFVGASSSFELQRDHPEIFQNAIELKKYADRIIETVGGRAVHPVASVPGGFKSFPTKEKITALIPIGQKTTEIAETTLRLFATFKYPQLKREIISSALYLDHEYAIYNGDIWNSKGDIFKAEKYHDYIYEELKPYTRAKFGTLKGYEMVVGAAARLNINGFKNLSPKTQELIEEFNITLPLNNPFDNIMAQAIENHHFAAQSVELLEYFQKTGVKNEKLVVPSDFGKGTAACEAPRGTLFHYYNLDKDGFIEKCDIITPTVQTLPAIEFDLKNLSPLLKDLSPSERSTLIETLIRAYDPCITCATH